MMHALAAHLWQSTFFALAAGLLTFAFRGNRAQVRYWLWLSASLKFLVPFALLLSFGGLLETWSPVVQKVATEVTTPTISYTMEQFSAPLPVEPSAPGRIHWIPSAIFAVWFCGFLTIATIRFRSWLRVRRAVRTGTVVDISASVEVRVSPGLLEPGVVGLLRPTLLLPDGIAERLTPSELNAVLAHELCHVRRRDNLFAALHMIVEAVFWFHPLVWWIGARLVEERERACDEEVLSLGNAPDVYADAILNVCKLYVESPLVCVSGVSGASIRRRVEAIMSNRRLQGLNRAKKLLLAAAGVAALVGPVAVGLLIGVGNTPAIHAQTPAPRPQAAPLPEFDAASIRKTSDSSGGGGRSGSPGGPPLQFTPGMVVSRGAAGVTARRIILDAYHLFPYQLSGGSGWLDSERFSLEARSEASADENQLRLMLQTLLSQRFGLVVRREAREMPVYALVVGKKGMKLHELKDGDPAPPQPETLISAGAQALHVAGVAVPISPYIRITMQAFAGSMSGNPLANLDRPVVDKTGLQGLYSFTFMWDPNEDYKAAVEELLGLKFVAEKDAVDVFVIDSIERPSEN